MTVLALLLLAGAAALDNTCNYAYDDECDDGTSSCTDGTDCCDCGTCASDVTCGVLYADNSCTQSESGTYGSGVPNDNACDDGTGVWGQTCDPGTDCTDCDNCGELKSSVQSSSGSSWGSGSSTYTWDDDDATAAVAAAGGIMMTVVVIILVIVGICNCLVAWCIYSKHQGMVKAGQQPIMGATTMIVGIGVPCCCGCCTGFMAFCFPLDPSPVVVVAAVQPGVVGVPVAVAPPASA
jgi:hypothetical protein